MATTKKNRWLQVSIILFAIGCTLQAVNQGVYAPRYNAFGKALHAFAENHGVGSPPTPDAYDLDVTAFFVSGLLGVAGFILVVIGATYLVIIFIEKIIRRSGTPV